MVRNMTEGDPLKLILPFMVPLLIGNVFQQLYNIADNCRTDDRGQRTGGSWGYSASVHDAGCADDGFV